MTDYESFIEHDIKEGDLVVTEQPSQFNAGDRILRDDTYRVIYDDGAITDNKCLKVFKVITVEGRIYHLGLIL